jgi:Spy/CpxP family protein refolding chaperone
MKRFLPSLVLAAAGLAVFAASAVAGDGAGGAGRMHGGFAMRRFHKCLASLDLNADQKSAIQGIVSAARPNLQADMQTVRADRKKIKADVDAGADKAVIGQDVLTAHADRAKLEADAQAVRDQVIAKLSPDQQTQAKACLQAPAGHRGDSHTQ